MSTVIGTFIFLVPLAFLAGYGSKLAASRLSAGRTWLKIAIETVLLAACLLGLVSALQFFQSGQDMLGLSLILIALAGLGVLVRASAIVGNLVGMRPRF